MNDFIRNLNNQILNFKDTEYLEWLKNSYMNNYSNYLELDYKITANLIKVYFQKEPIIVSQLLIELNDAYKYARNYLCKKRYLNMG